MVVLRGVLNAIGDIAIGPWLSLSVALLISASLLAVVIVGLFRLVARPQEIRRARNRLWARTMELVLFGHDGRSLLTATGRILHANANYLCQFAAPIALSAIPVMLLLIQGAAWFERRPYRVGDPIVVEVALTASHSIFETPVSLKTADCLSVTAGPVRIPSDNELCYRLIGKESGDGWVELTVGGQTIRKQIAIGERLTRVAVERRQGWASVFYPAEEPLAANGPLTRISTPYPRRTWDWGYHEYDAGLVGLILTLVMSLVVARLLGVSIV